MTEETCSKCGTSLDDRCEVKGCGKVAEFEAWFRVTDPFTGKSIKKVLMQVCEDHVKQSIPFQKNGEKTI